MIQISILMAVYNTNIMLIDRAVQSVLRQTLQDFELIILDDGSNEITAEHLKSYVKNNSPKITYIQHANIGQSKTINRGIDACNGRYITILDSDDEYKPNHLETCIANMNHYDLIASTTTTIVDSENDYFVLDKNHNNKIIHVDDCILFATLFGKKEVFATIKFNHGYAADATFYEAASMLYNVKKLDLRTYIYYRNNANSITALFKKRQLQD